MKVSKRRNEQRVQILDLIYAQHQISRVDIARLTGITAAITSDIVGELITTGKVIEVGETGPSTAGSGRRRILLAAKPQQAYYIGSELSEKNFTFCLTDNLGSIIEQATYPVTETLQAKQISAERYHEQLAAFIEKTQAYQPRAIGISVPGHFNRTSHVIASNNQTWQQFNVDTALAGVSLPTFLENNVHCMAAAERLLPHETVADGYIFFHVSRGMFASYVYQGKVYGADNFLVGEVGHMIVNPDGEFCECGRRGCLQTYASEAWIIKKAQILYQNTASTYLHQLVADAEHITIEAIMQAFTMGDDGVITILTNAMKYLAIALNNLSVMIASKRIILHGQLFELAPLVKILNRFLAQNQFLINGVEVQPVSVKPYQLQDGAVAAAMLAVKNNYFNDNQEAIKSPKA